MPFETYELLREISNIPQVQGMRVSVASGIPHAAIVGVSSFIGRALGGLIGGTIGGIVGNMIAGNMQSLGLQTVSSIIRTMILRIKVALTSAISAVFNNSSVLQMLRGRIATFFITQLGMQAS